MSYEFFFIFCLGFVNALKSGCSSIDNAEIWRLSHLISNIVL